MFATSICLFHLTYIMLYILYSITRVSRELLVFSQYTMYIVDVVLFIYWDNISAHQNVQNTFYKPSWSHHDKQFRSVSQINCEGGLKNWRRAGWPTSIMKQQNISQPQWKLFGVTHVSSVESQKGTNAVERCSVENQKAAIAVQSLWR